MVKKLSILNAISLLFATTIFNKTRWQKTLVFDQA